VVSTDGDYSASTIGCDGIILGAANVGTFDVNTFSLVLGADGFDASAASGATLVLGSGDIVSRGNFLVHASATLTEETATLVMDGGTSSTPLSLDFPGDIYGFVVAESAFVDSVGDVGFDGVVDIYGTLDVDTTFAISGGATATFNDNAILTGGIYNIIASDVVIANGNTITNSYIQISSGGSIEVAAGILSTVLQTTNSTAGTIDIVAGTRLGDVLVNYSAANLATIAFGTNTEVNGDITESGSTGTNAATGLITLAGTADQTINVPQLDLSGATFQGTKSSGNIIPTAGDITQGGAFTCEAIVADAAYSDTWETNGYSLTTTAGAYFGAGDFSVTGGSIVIGAGDYYGDTGGSVTITGSSKVILGASYDSDDTDTGPWILEYAIAHVHVVRAGIFSVDTMGNVLSKDDPSVTIKQHLNTSMGHRVIADVTIPNSANSPSVEDYIAAEADDDYVVHYLGQSMIISYLRTSAGGFG
jgi:hypothetical protein